MKKEKPFEIIGTDEKPTIREKPKKIYKVKSYSQRILEGFLKTDKEYGTIKLAEQYTTRKGTTKTLKVLGIVRGLGRRIKEQKLNVKLLGYDEEKREIYLGRTK